MQLADILVNFGVDFAVAGAVLGLEYGGRQAVGTLVMQGRRPVQARFDRRLVRGVGEVVGLPIIFMAVGFDLMIVVFASDLRQISPIVDLDPARVGAAALGGGLLLAAVACFLAVQAVSGELDERVQILGQRAGSPPRYLFARLQAARDSQRRNMILLLAVVAILVPVSLTFLRI